jgi:hypothetical protein
MHRSSPHHQSAQASGTARAVGSQYGEMGPAMGYTMVVR